MSKVKFHNQALQHANKTQNIPKMPAIVDKAPAFGKTATDLNSAHQTITFGSDDEDPVTQDHTGQRVKQILEDIKRKRDLGNYSYKHEIESFLSPDYVSDKQYRQDPKQAAAMLSIQVDKSGLPV